MDQFPEICMKRYHVPVPLHNNTDSVNPLLVLLAAVSDVDGSEQDVEVSNMLNTFDQILIYFHGFPDLSVHPTRNTIGSRLPLKLMQGWLRQSSTLKRGFLTFNFGGVIGSDQKLSFYRKTLSQEVQDAISICQYAQNQLLATSSNDLTQSSLGLHVVGLSTGAIIASLIRSAKLLQDSKVTTLKSITAIAGIPNVQEGVELDFSSDQLNEFKESHACWKEFYLPQDCNIQTILSHIPQEQMKIEENSTKLYLRLHENYVNECLNPPDLLDIKQAVNIQGSPRFLVIHGTHDIHVPFELGQRLFTFAIEPKTFVSISRANHLLSSDKHVKKALRSIFEYIDNTD